VYGRMSLPEYSSEYSTGPFGYQNTHKGIPMLIDARTYTAPAKIKRPVPKHETNCGQLIRIATYSIIATTVTCVTYTVYASATLVIGGLY
jgi:hypothetical protein